MTKIETIHTHHLVTRGKKFKYKVLKMWGMRGSQFESRMKEKKMKLFTSKKGKASKKLIKRIQTTMNKQEKHQVVRRGVGAQNLIILSTSLECCRKFCTLFPSISRSFIYWCFKKKNFFRSQFFHKSIENTKEKKVGG